MKPKSLPKDDVCIYGIGITPVGEHWEKSLRELALEAITLARNDAGGLRPQALYVANMLSPYLSGQTHLAALLADFAGLRGVEAVTIEAAGASGGAAVRQAYLALLSGMIDSALVVGVEKITERTSSELEAAVSSASDVDHEAVHGVTPTAQAALLMRRYLYEHNAPPDALAGFSIVAHANGATNPNAMYQKAVQEEQYAKAPMVSEPVNLFDAAPNGDGAAALFLAKASGLPDAFPFPGVRISASASVSSVFALHDQPDPLVFSAARSSVASVFEQANRTPDDIDFFELHDRFTIFAALSLESAGFARRGEGWRLAKEGAITRTGDIPILTFGGSKARGDVGGATGVYQIAEATLQIQERADLNQVPNAHVGLVQCLGGMGATVTTHILERIDGP
jgi:acetyl-CoA C-acetyltransferase